MSIIVIITKASAKVTTQSVSIDWLQEELPHFTHTAPVSRTRSKTNRGTELKI